ncbi:MAG TPA: DUF4214 domain-containing protein [Pyrinomonadaceae bacterium]|jgi:photosystem II stability/assembly factor-like uncharacterized protein
MIRHTPRTRLVYALALFLALTASLFAASAARTPPQAVAVPRVQERRDFEQEDGGHIRERIELYRRRHETDPARRLQLARADHERRAAREKMRAAGELEVEPSWRPLGPSDGSGRMTAVAPHPTAAGTLYVGADGGGVWKTTDGGATWACLTDSLNNLAVGALAVAPSSPNIIYLGTGSESSGGIGLLKSADGGATWSLPAGVAASRFYGLAVHPGNPQELLAATGSGMLLSTDGGNTWTTAVRNATVFDVERDPSNPLVVYAAASFYIGNVGVRFLKSSDGGRNWAEKSWGVPGQASTSVIAVAPSDPRVIYASTEFGLDASSGKPFTHVYKSSDRGETWAELPAVANSDTFAVRHALGGQAWHDNAIAVSPADPNVVMVAGVHYIRSADGGATWSPPPFTPSAAQTFCPNCFNMHPDATDLRYQGSTLYIANDGGIFSTPDHGNTSRRHNVGLTTRQYYALTNDAVFTTRALAGAQDNGTDRRDAGTSWTNVGGGDGFDSAISPQSPNVAYATIQYGDVFRTRNLATSGDLFANRISPPYEAGEPRPFRTLLAMDMAAPSVLYTATSRVWRTTNGGDTWAPLPTTTTDGSAWDGQGIWAIAVSRGGGPVLMVSKSGGIFRSADGGATWAKVKNDSFVSNIEIDPRDPNTAYAVSGGGNTVLATRNGGATWSTLGQGLPPFVSPQVVRVDPSDSSVLYCGTMAGVYRSADRGANWAPVGAGLPSVSVEDLRVTEDGSTLRAATYGRGVWELAVRQPATVDIAGRMTDGAGNALANASVLLVLGDEIIGLAPTDAQGNYSFKGLARGRTYGVRPAKQYFYAFTPGNRSFPNLSDNQTLDFVRVNAPNPVDASQFFVRQHYRDFLSREPDAAGLAFWTNEIESCGANAQCREVKRINVSAAFFLSIEFQETGYLVYRAHKAAFGTPFGRPVPLTRQEMLDDAKIIGAGVVVGAADWEQRLEQNKRAYFDQFVARQRFTGFYPQAMTAEQFVDALNANSGGSLSQPERNALVADLKAGAKTRAAVLRAVAEDADLKRAELNRAFVLMEYFGYLRRNPNDAPDADLAGYNFWLSKLNEFGGNYIAAEMVKAFISAAEYRGRFTAEQLSFVAGEPGLPGDGVITTGADPGRLDLRPTYPLAGLTQGLALSVYLADEPPSLPNVQFNFTFGNSTPGCATSFGGGVSGRREVISYLGARQGFALIVTQAELNSLVATANAFRPGCGFTLADGSLDGFYISLGSPPQFIRRLDAMAVGRAPTSLLGDKTE